MFALRILNEGIALVRTFVLARLLAPNDFGLFGIAMLALSSLEAFSLTGFDAALIQRKEDADLYLDSAWTIQIIRGGVLAAILVVGAPLVGIFFEEPRAVSIVRVLGVVEFIKGFQNIGVVYLRKELEFQKQFFYQLSGTVSNLVVALPAAFIFRSAWALVVGLLAANTVMAIVSYLVHDYRPRLSFDLHQGKDLFDYGRWRLASSVLVFLLIQGDDFFLGKLLGVTALGLYQMAYKISNLPATEITHIISQVTFPAYAKMQESVDLLRRGFIQVIQLTTFLSFPVAAGIACLAHPLTSLFLGEDWLSMVPTIQALTLWGLIRSLEAATSPVWMAVGEPHKPAVFQATKVVLLALLIYPLTHRWGILGTALAVVAESVVVHILRFCAMAKTLECNPFELFKHFLVPAAGSAVMSAMLITVMYVVPEVNFWFIWEIG